MKRIIQSLGMFAVALSALSSNCQAANSQQTMTQGETKYVTLKMAGAFSAKSVSVSGKGITASINKKYHDKVKVKLQSTRSALPGLRDIKVRLAAGTNRTPLHLFGIKRAEINRIGNALAGKFQKVEISLPNTAGKVTVHSTCMGSENGSYDRAKTGKGYFKIKRTVNKRTFWIGTAGKNQRTNCDITITERSVMDNRESSSRRTTFQFQRDPSAQSSLSKPRAKTADNLVVKTDYSKANSPRLNWHDVNHADRYIVRYRKYNPHHGIPPLDSSGWKNVRIVKNQRLSNLNRGSYAWCVKAVYEPPKPTLLHDVISDCSTVRKFRIEGR